MFLVEIPALTVGIFRLVRSSHHLEVGGHWWQAASINIELPAEDAEGSLGELAVSIPNTSRVPMAYCESPDISEIHGRVMTCSLWNTGLDPDAGVLDVLSWPARILKTVATAKAVRLECGHPAQTARAPGPVFGRDRFPGLLPSSGVPLIGD
ncbi:MAG: hypothetical protein ACREJO_12190 [Phycisphaerales bacterium]